MKSLSKKKQYFDANSTARYVPFPNMLKAFLAMNFCDNWSFFFFKTDSAGKNFVLHDYMILLYSECPI